MGAFVVGPSQDNDLVLEDGVGRVYHGGGDFVFVGVPEVSSIEPHEVLSSGGRSVTVHGRGFVDTGRIVCSMTATKVSAVYLTSSRIECAVPASAVGSRLVRVSNDGSVFSAGSIVVSVVDAVELLGAEPSSGPVRGGTVVSIGMSTFGFEAARCRFGKEWVAGTVGPRTRVVCRTPAHTGAASVVDVEVSTESEEEGVSTKLAFEYERMAEVDVLSPTRGDARGGGVVSVSGTGFGERARCRFGAQVVRGQPHSSTLMVCVVPAHVGGEPAGAGGEG